jgi:hypothetical protein
MLPWWGWALLWSALLLGTAVLVALRLRWLWRRFRALLTELGRAEDSLTRLEDRVEELRNVGPTPSALLTDRRVLHERYAADRAAQRQARDARRAARWPAWAVSPRSQPTVSRRRID